MAEKINALMVEDLQMAQVTAMRLFTQLSCNLHIAPMAIKGLEKIIQTEYDVIFLDIQLPDINGLDIIHSIRVAEQDEKRVPIIIVTSTPTEALKIKAKQLGGDDFIAKPLTLDSIRSVLLKHLDESKHKLLNG